MPYTGTKRRGPFAPTVFIGLALALTSGCVSATSKQLAASFGQASAGVATKTAAVLSEVRQDQAKFKIANALRFADAAVEDVAKPDIDIQSISVRIALLDEIRKYGVALVTLAIDDELQRIDKASRDLSDALGSLNSTVGAQKEAKKAPVKEEDLRLVATAVNIAGRSWFEHKRLKAMQTVTETADPVISAAVDLVLQEFVSQDNGGKETPKTWEKSLRVSLGDRGRTLYGMAQTTAAFDPSTDAPNNRSLAVPRLDTLATRQALIVEAQQLLTRADSLAAEFNQLAAALTQIKRAHTDLTQALKSDTEANVATALGSLSALNGEASRIAAFYAVLGRSDQ